VISKALLILLVAVIGALPSLAYASPPDQTWLTGFFDDADHDDVILIITESSGAPAIAPIVVPRPACDVGWHRAPAIADPELAERAPAYQRRAPPSA
jgi:hypothetical protein